MPKKKARKRVSLKKFFTAIGGGALKTGRAAQRLGAAAKISRPPREKAGEVARRLRELKRLELMREEEFKEERRIREETTWGERVEFKRPLSERLSEVFYAPLKRPAKRLAKSFKGLEEDLYRANIRVTPERYVAMMIGTSLIVTAFAVVLMLLLRVPSIFTLLGGFLAFGFSFTLIKSHPKRRSKGRVGEINRVLPFGLRHMATQLSSGIGLPETMTSVSQAGYGSMSEEFGRVIRDMHAGMSMEEALTTMDKRVDSEPLRRATRQIGRTLRTGGGLSRTLNTLADETAFEMHMKLRGYTQSLNMLTMVYMFASAVIPAMLIIVMAVGARMGGMPLTPQTAAVLFLVILPVLLFYFVMMIKRFEPRL